MIYRFSCITLFSVLFSFNQLNAQIYLKLAAETDMTFDEIVAETELYFDEVGRERGKGYKPFRRWKYEMQRSLRPDGRINTAARQMENYNKFMAKNPMDKSVGNLFTDLGPVAATNTSTWSSALGRLSAVGLDINDPNHFIGGSPSGGIWRSLDGGTSWTEIYDYALNININALEISHSDPSKYYAGTSEEILISSDHGETWVAATTGPTGQQINTIIMDPVDPNILLATDRYGDRIWRSTDGGYNWSNVHSAPNDTYDIEFQPGNNNIVYASGKGFIAKSTDNGASWTNLAGGPWGGGVIMLAVSPNDPNYLYALQETSGGYNATFLSTDSGASWTTQSDNSSGTNNILTYNQSSTGGQAPRDMDICVSPDDKTEVYVAGTELWKSTDSGVSFTKVADWLVNSSLPFIHADVDLLYFNNNGLYAGTDGGLFISTDNANSFTDVTSGIGVRQFYRIGVAETEVDRVSGGSQDNGTGVLKSGTWYDFAGADGMETFIDWSDKDIIYGNVQFGLLLKSTDGGTTMSYTTQTPNSGAWVTPTEQDPVNSNTIYQGKLEVYKSTDGGNSWSAISNTAGVHGNCREIEVAPSDNQVIYASWSSVMMRTTDGGMTWDDISPGGFINYIDVHPTDPTRVAIAQSGEIWESTDSGDTWTDITSNLPDITYYCVLYANDGNMGMFLGGSPGVWYKDNSTAGNWSNVSRNLPIVQCRELEVRHNKLYVATYGRGLWRANITNEKGFDCDSPISLYDVGTFTAPGPNHGNGCHNCSGSNATHANWYKFTPPSSGDVNIFSCNGNVNTRLWVYSGTCDALTQIGSSDDDCEISYNGSMLASSISDIPVMAGVPIYIEWDNEWSEDSFFWTIEYSGTDCPPDYAGVNALSGIQNSSFDFETDGGIESSQVITGASTVIDYDSNSSITLLPDFEVVLGAIFNAFIDGCNGLFIKEEEKESEK